MNISEMNQWLADQAYAASVQWFKLVSENNFAACYLYYRTGALAVFSDKNAPEGWMLGSGERLSIGMTREQVAAKIIEIARRLPCLPSEESK